jgi:hypothetical protein
MDLDRELNGQPRTFYRYQRSFAKTAWREV